MTRNRLSATSAARPFRRSAYSWAALMSWIEQGPTTTNRRWSLPSRMLRITSRPSATVRNAAAVRGISRLSCSGVIRVSLEATLRSSIGKSAIVLFISQSRHRSRMPAASDPRAAEHSIMGAAGDGTLARNTSARQWGQAALIGCERPSGRVQAGIQAGIGEVRRMPGDPLLGNGLDGLLLAGLLFALMAIVLDLTDLLDHPGAKQGVFIEKRDAHQVIGAELAAPSDDPGIAGLQAKQGGPQFDGRASAKTAARVARHPAKADIVQALARQERLLAQHQFHRHIAWVTQKTTHRWPAPDAG